MFRDGMAGWKLGENDAKTNVRGRGGILISNEIGENNSRTVTFYHDQFDHMV